MHITLAVAILPAVLLVYLFKKWDEKRPEPPGMVRNAVIFGMVSIIPAVIIELTLSAILGTGLVQAQGQLVNSFVVAAGVEEGLKLSIVMLYFWRKEAFNEVMDGILYTAATSLGFALLENVLYAGGNIVTGIARAISAVPLHATCSAIMGYFVGRAKMRGSAFVKVSLGYGIAVFIHGLYDWAVFSGGKFGFAPPEPLLGFAIAVGIVVVCALVTRQLVKSALKEDDALLGDHARPLERPLPYHLAQRGYGAPFGHPAFHPAAPAPYGMHTPYGGHAPNPYGPPQGWHQPMQPHAYPQHPYPGPHPHGHAPQPQAPQPHAPQAHAPQAPPQQAGWGQAPGYGAPQGPGGYGQGPGGYGPGGYGSGGYGSGGGGGWPPPGGHA
ncbi:MAG: PrsW family intramembrane metalloprotease [Polyangiaceae bacterium]|nr:PrsW family intramembrane metalloprotease [Polyangiaceae bacterium]